MPTKLGRPKRSVAARQSEHGTACKMHAVICVARRHSDIEPGKHDGRDAVQGYVTARGMSRPIISMISGPREKGAV